MKHVSALLLVAVGIIHLLPAVGVLGQAQLARLYGLMIDDPDLLVLMRHRAVMFGLLGLLLFAAAWRPELRVPAYVAGLVSAASFVGIAWSVGGYNALIGRVVMADIIAVACLLGAAAIDFGARRAEWQREVCSPGCPPERPHEPR